MFGSDYVEYWRAQLMLPLSERLGPAPAGLIDYIAGVNLAAGAAAMPQSTNAPADFIFDVQAAIAELPLAVTQHLERQLLGVYFGRCLGSSAVADVVVDPAGKVIGTAVVLDLTLLEHTTANAWMTAKEAMPFSADGDFSVHATIARDGEDHRRNALQFLLLHEFGHVVATGQPLLPDWWDRARRMRSTDEYSFLPISWQITMAQQIIALLRDDFPLRGQLAYYAPATLDNTAMPLAYQALEQTRFATLYASTNAFEDFAESFATYVHVVLLHKPLEVVVRERGAPVLTLSRFWDSPRSRQKAQILADFLCSPDTRFGESP